MTRKKINIEITSKKIYQANIILTDNKGKKIKEFKRNVNIKSFEDFKKAEEGNEKVILKFYKKQHEKSTGKEYKSTTQKEFGKQFSSFIDLHKNKDKIKNIHNFKNQNRIITSNRNLNIKRTDFKWTYINCKVKIFLNGYYTYSFGRSRYFTRRLRKAEINPMLREAIIHAIAPYGSNVKFKLIDWSFAFKQIKSVHFDKKETILLERK